jgi:general L-amino acid transport system substrate-binding protein
MNQTIRSAALAAAALATGVFGLGSPAAAGPTLDAIKKNGYVHCGVNTGVAGFSLPDSQGNWKGIDVDVCRALAAAVFGDATKTKFTPLTAQARFTAVQSGEIDVLLRNSTVTLTRDSQLGLNYAGINFYDGQAFMVRKDSKVAGLKQLDGATVCVAQGTTHESNLADTFRGLNVNYKPVVLEQQDRMYEAFFGGRCDAMTQDFSALAAALTTQTKTPDDYVILPERISKEPLGPFVRHGDDQWFDIVKYTFMAMIEAEEKGVTSANIDKMAESGSPEVKRFLGTGAYGKALGLDDDKFAFNIVKQVGNYGESFDRNVGKGSALKLERGLNDLWSRGGLMYAIPFR